MSETPLLALPLIEAAQAQKHITHNEALLILDAAIHLAVITRSLAAPPATPADGDRYLVAAGAAGAWAGHAGQLAFREAGAWRFAAPRNGWRLWAIDEQKFLLFDGAAWRNVANFDVIQNVSLLGVNTAANAGNRLSVSSPATLLTHEGAGHQLKINKQAAVNTASLLFQTNFSGRAEMGLAGDDNFHFKVSPDGAAWNEAIQIDKASGLVTLTGNSVANAALADMAAARIKGRATAGAGDPEDLTGTQATALLDTFTGTAKGLAPASSGGTANFLRADGIFATPSGSGGTPSVASVAALRLLTAASYSSATVYLESWYAGLNRGGGHFYYNSTSSVADDGGLTIVDASGRRWLRQLEGGGLSPTMFGAKADGTTNDAAALQAALNAVAASYNPGQGFYDKYVDLEGLQYQTTVSLDCAKIRSGREWSVVNGTIIGACLNRAVFDCTGSQFLNFENVYVNGSLTSMPMAAWQFARHDAGGGAYPEASVNTLRGCAAAGHFAKAAIMGYGSEIFRIDRGNFSNSAMSQTAAVAVVSGSRQTFLNTVGDLVSDYAILAAGNLSNSAQSFEAWNCRRSAAVALTMASVTRANPAVVAVSDLAALNTAIASFGFGNGTAVTFTQVAGMTQLNGNVYTVANLNAVAGTFELFGCDSTAFGIFTGGTCYNQTGPNLVLGHVKGVTIENSYFQTYGRPGLKLYIDQGTDENWDIDIHARFETGNQRDIEIVGDTTTRYIRGFRYRIDSSGARAAPIFSSGVSGAGQIVIDDIEVHIGNAAQTPSAGLFENPATFNLRSGFIAVPTGSFVNTGFIGNHAEWAAAGDSYKHQYYGNRRFFDNPNFYRSAAIQVVATFETDDAALNQGPLVDIKRSSASPAASDYLGHLRFIGKDSAATDTEYAGLRAQITDPTDTSEDGTIDILTTVAGTLTSTARFGGGAMLPASVAGGDVGLGTININGGYYIGGALIADATHIPVIGPASATDNAIARFDLATGKLIQNSNVILADDGSLQLPEVAAPAAPAADKVNVFAYDVGARSMPAWMASSGSPYVTQPFLGLNKIGCWNAGGGTSGVPGAFGFNGFSTLGTATNRTPATTGYFTRVRRLGFLSGATAGSFAGVYNAARICTIGDGTSLGGFHYICRFGVSDPATVAGARMFVGLTTETVAPTNIEPNTLANCVGAAQLSTSGNLHIVYGGSAAQTAIDLGANFPANTLSVDMYELSLFAPVNSQVIHYRVVRLNTGQVATGTLSGTVGTVIPAATTRLAPYAWRCNNTTALDAGLDLSTIYLETWE